MQFVYGFVPQEDFESIVREQARQMAVARLKRLDKTMRLEQQGLAESDQDKALQDMMDKIVMEQPKEMWDA